MAVGHAPAVRHAPEVERYGYGADVKETRGLRVRQSLLRLARVQNSVSVTWPTGNIAGLVVLTAPCTSITSIH